MEGVTALLAGLLDALRRSGAPDLCPGEWAWAVTALGVGVGLLPTVGALVVALLRKRMGSRYGTGASFALAAIGIMTAGLLPLLVFTATGSLFRADAEGAPVPVLGPEALGELGSDSCLVLGSQAHYLGSGTVAGAFTGGALEFVFALFLLVLAPLVVVAFVLLQARLALRRGPRWPSRYFWVPTLAVAVLTAGVPAGTAGHLWLGAGVGAFLGVFVLLLAGPPRHAVVQRSTAAAGSAPAPAAIPTPRAAPADRGHAPGRDPVGRPHPPTLVAAAPPFPAPVPAAPDAPRFRIVRRLGSGGFGRVWLAHDTRLGHVVALKAAHAPDAETERRIQREARALAAVRHPHCVRIHDLVPARSDTGLSELDGMVIVMGYVEGSSLGDLVRSRGVLDDVAAARVWLSVAGALHAAHQRGVMHRDVKPGNVVVDPGGFAHLIDFGIARKTGDVTMTQAGFVLGTPDFLSPEVACGERATHASDAWQLAATVSFALTGQPPRGGHPDAVSGLRAAASGAALSQLPRRSAHLALLQAAMDNDPARRPPLPAVQRALSDWLQRSGSGVAGPVTSSTRVR